MPISVHVRAIIDSFIWYQYNTGMKSILIRELDPKTLSALKRLAAYHNRSLQGELHAIIEKAASKAPDESMDEELDLFTVKTNKSGTWSREEIYGDDGR